MTPNTGNPDVVALASEVSLAIAASPDLDEMLSSIAQRVAESLDVWECNIYEYEPETDSLRAVALWAREISDRDRAWLGTVESLAERTSFQDLIRERALREYHVNDPNLRQADVDLLQEWGEKSVLSVPLVFQDEVIGALSLVEKRAPRRFSPGDLKLIELMAVPAAVAVHNARMFRREAAQNRRLAALVSASRAMTSTIDLDRLLATIAQAAGQALDTAECAINTFDRETDALTVAAYWQRDPQEDPADWLGRTYLLSDFPSDRTLLFGGAEREETVSDPDIDEANRRNMIDYDEKTHLSVPMHYEGRPTGLLVFIELEHERHFTAGERAVARALAEQAAAAIHNAEILRRSERQNRTLDLLLTSIRAISSSVDLDKVLDSVARTATEVLDAEQCQIQEYDSRANTVKPVALFQRHPDDLSPQSLGQVFSLDDEPDEHAFLEAKLPLEQLFSDPDLRDSTRQAMIRFGDKSYMNIPLVFNDQPVGVLVLVETEYERHYDDEEIALAQALAEQAAVAIEHARLYDQVKAQAITDGLTGLYNHRYFYERLDQEIARARRYGTPVSLMMIDIDDFKLFNDRHGHPAGDAALREMAHILNEELRQNLDLAARYGGEEFAVVLPNTPMDATGETQMEIDLEGVVSEQEPPPPGHRDGAESVAERIRERIAATAFPDEHDVARAHLTVSVGVAVFPHKTGSPEDLVRNADAALYKAKRAGKDRVEGYG